MIKSLVAMMDRRTAYLILAVEAQSNVHYAMPVKNMVYDALQYAKQVSAAAASHKRSGDYKGADVSVRVHEAGQASACSDTGGLF